MRKGLHKVYNAKKGELSTLKGRLLLQRQLALQAKASHKFATEYLEYNHLSYCNCLIWKTLELLGKVALQNKVHHQRLQLLQQLPFNAKSDFNLIPWEELLLDRQTQDYQKALSWARLIWESGIPNNKPGKNEVVAFLVDMNLVFEKYIFNKIKRASLNICTVTGQRNKLFWKNRQLRPDILIHYKGETIVLDTKWKILKKAEPSIQDLRQLYVYNQYFKATKGILLFPASNELQTEGPIPFESINDEQPAQYCQLYFTNVVEHGRLKKNIGEQLLGDILPLKD